MEQVQSTDHKHHVLSGLGETIWRTTRVKLPEGKDGEKARQDIKADKRMLLQRAYWRCPACERKVACTDGACGECGTERPSSTLLDDKEEIEELVRGCMEKLKGVQVSGIGDLGMRELLMHVGIFLNELYAAKEAGLLG